jgi:hypothetical protein
VTLEGARGESILRAGKRLAPVRRPVIEADHRIEARGVGGAQGIEVQ